MCDMLLIFLWTAHQKHLCENEINMQTGENDANCETVQIYSNFPDQKLAYECTVFQHVHLPFNPPAPP